MHVQDVWMIQPKFSISFQSNKFWMRFCCHEDVDNKITWYINEAVKLVSKCVDMYMALVDRNMAYENKNMRKCMLYNIDNHAFFLSLSVNEWILTLKDLYMLNYNHNCIYCFTTETTLT